MPTESTAQSEPMALDKTLLVLRSNPNHILLSHLLVQSPPQPRAEFERPHDPAKAPPDHQHNNNHPLHAERRNLRQGRAMDFA